MILTEKQIIEKMALQATVFNVDLEKVGEVPLADVMAVLRNCNFKTEALADEFITVIFKRFKEKEAA